jgi:hypothetical protein
LVVVFLLAVSACGGQPKGTVKGTVKYKGTIVPMGQVIFYGEGDQSAIGPINEDGSYEAKNVPVGEVRIAVVTPPSAAGVEARAKAGEKRFGKGNPLPQKINVVEVPKKYNSPGQSGLGLSVHQGSQAYDINLK